MTDWPGALARAFQQHLEIGGSSGSAGSRRKIEKLSNGFQGREPGTSSPNAVVPVVPETNPPDAHVVPRTTATTADSRMVPGRAKQEDQHEQSPAEPGTSHTIGTTENYYVRASPNDLFEERAAIAEDGAGAPRNWAESFVRLDIAERPPDFTGKAWRKLIEDGGRFLDRWANEAARLGWSALDVFGVHPGRSLRDLRRNRSGAAYQRRRRGRYQIGPRDSSDTGRNFADLFASAAAGRNRCVETRQHQDRDARSYRGG
jgi:hypothetical protein